jgi:hypothetical protein
MPFSDGIRTLDEVQSDSRIEIIVRIDDTDMNNQYFALSWYK